MSRSLMLMWQGTGYRKAYGWENNTGGRGFCRYGYAGGVADGDSGTGVDSESESDTDEYSDPNPESESNADKYSNPESDAYTDANLHTDANPDKYAHTYSGAGCGIEFSGKFYGGTKFGLSGAVVLGYGRGCGGICGIPGG